MAGDKVAYFASTDYKSKHTPFGIKASDRDKHIYALGKAGMGKTTLLENLAIQDIERGEGLAYIDPTGISAAKLLSFIPKERIDATIHFSLADTEYPFSFNVLHGISEGARTTATAAITPVLRRVWRDAWSERVEELVLRALPVLMDVKGATLFSLSRFFSDDTYRAEAVALSADAEAKRYWGVYASAPEHDAVAPLCAKIDALEKNQLIRAVLGQPASSFSFDECIAKRKMLIVNLAKGQVGEEIADLIGSLLVARLYHAALSRAHENAPHFFIFVDEFHSLGKGSIAAILAEARRAKLCFTLAHEQLADLDDEHQTAVLANVGTTIAFRVSPEDSATLSGAFNEKVGKEDLVRLGFAQVYLTLAIDGAVCPPFSAVTLPPIKPPSVSFHAEIIARSRTRYAHPRTAAESAAALALTASASGALVQGDKTSAPAGAPAVSALKSALSSLTGSVVPPASGLAPAPAAARPPGPPGPPGAPVPAGPREVPEKVLRDLLYVEPLSA